MGIDIFFISNTIGGGELEELTKKQFARLEKRVNKALKNSKIKQVWKFDKKNQRLELIDRQFRDTPLWVVPHLLLILREMLKLSYPIIQDNLIFDADYYVGTIRIFEYEGDPIINVTFIPENSDGDDSGPFFYSIALDDLDNFQDMYQFFTMIRQRETALVKGRNLYKPITNVSDYIALK